MCPTRRQEKVARVVKEAVSDAIANHLNDPRIEGLVSVTRVDVAADLRIADVYISIFGGKEISEEEGKVEQGTGRSAENKTFAAITSARSRIQSAVANKLHSKFCPVLRFHKDEQFKKTLETMKLIEQAMDELREKDSIDKA